MIQADGYHNVANRSFPISTTQIFDLQHLNLLKKNQVKNIAVCKYNDIFL